MKKLFVLMLALVFVLSVACLVACDSRDPDIVVAYNLYAENAKANGQTPLTYDQWLASIRGEDGKDGKDGVDGKSAYQIWLDNGHT